MSAPARYPADSPVRQADRVWRKVCAHLNGMGLSGSVNALDRAGAFGRLAGADAPLMVDDLSRYCGLAPGYARLAWKLLASQGWLACGEGLGQTGARLELTPAGREWLATLPIYGAAGLALAIAQGLGTWLAGGPLPASVRDWPSAEMGSLAGTWADEARRQVRGALVAAVLGQFSQLGMWEALAAGPVPLAALSAPPDALGFAFEVLAREGWAWLEGDRAGLTEEGQVAREWAPQYFAPLSYLPSFLAAPDLVAGRAPAADISPDASGQERHLDRALDIAFSGLVFARTCRQPFFDTVLPLFQDPSLDQQPHLVVDTGCGDGTLLLDLYQAIRQETRRGRHLVEYPLLLVGAEFNPQAGEIARKRLAEAGAPHMVIPGDIGDPEGLVAELSRRGLDPAQALHVSKSVFHNRTFRPPGSGLALHEEPPPTCGVFLDAQGGLIPPRDLLLNLVETLRAWRPLASRHGLVIIEAHNVDPTLAAVRRERQLITSLDAYHGFSHQYLVEASVQRWAAREAGFRTLRATDLGQAMTGQPLLTVDHLRPA